LREFRDWANKIMFPSLWQDFSEIILPAKDPPTFGSRSQTKGGFQTFLGRESRFHEIGNKIFIGNSRFPEIGNFVFFVGSFPDAHSP